MSKIDITGADIAAVIKSAYRHSRAQGLGFLHVRPGELDDQTVEEIIASSHGGTIYMDYVLGRAVKFAIYREEGKLLIRDTWYDHSEYELQQLLADIGFGPTKQSPGDPVASTAASNVGGSSEAFSTAMALMPTPIVQNSNPEPEPVRSGEGGDFGGAGASASWVDSPASNSSDSSSSYSSDSSSSYSSDSSSSYSSDSSSSY